MKEKNMSLDHSLTNNSFQRTFEVLSHNIIIRRECGYYKFWPPSPDVTVKYLSLLLIHLI